MKYYVIAKKWDDEKKKQVKYVAGVFPDFVCAILFRDAYTEHYKAKPEIMSEEMIMNFLKDWE